MLELKPHDKLDLKIKRSLSPRRKRRGRKPTLKRVLVILAVIVLVLLILWFVFRLNFSNLLP